MYLTFDLTFYTYVINVNVNVSLVKFNFNFNKSIENDATIVRV